MPIRHPLPSRTHSFAPPGSSKWFQHKMDLAMHWGTYTYNRDIRDLVACGAACGVCTAFKAPVGGVLFAMEMSTRWGCHGGRLAGGFCAGTGADVGNESASTIRLHPLLFCENSTLAARWRKELTWRCFLVSAITIVVSANTPQAQTPHSSGAAGCGRAAHASATC